MPDLIVAPRTALAAIFAGRCADLAVRAIAARGSFTLAIPGGSVAEAFVPALGAAAVDWTRTHVFWCDERAVSPDHPDSNYGRARALFRASGSGALAHLHPMPADAEDLDVAAESYARALETHAGCPPSIDLVLLGVGEDGHIGSLFPGYAALRERTRWVVAVTDAPKPPPRRLTLTMPVVERARTLCVAAFGATKSEAMRVALGDPITETPIALALRVARDAWVMLDHDAAAGVVGR